MINNCRISTCSALAAWPAPLLKAHTDRSWHRRGGLQLSATSVTSEQKIWKPETHGFYHGFYHQRNWVFRLTFSIIFPSSNSMICLSIFCKHLLKHWRSILFTLKQRENTEKQSIVLTDAVPTCLTSDWETVFRTVPVLCHAVPKPRSTAVPKAFTSSAIGDVFDETCDIQLQLHKESRMPSSMAVSATFKYLQNPRFDDTWKKKGARPWRDVSPCFTVSARCGQITSSISNLWHHRQKKIEEMRSLEFSGAHFPS